MAELRPKIVKLCKIIGGFSGVMNRSMKMRRNTTAWHPF